MVSLLAGRYRLGPQIGAGGSAAVFRAHDERLDREVAVKVLDESVAASADPAAQQRFERESRLAATFAHPNAVTVFDAGSEQGVLFLVMELLTGGSLAERLAGSGPMDSPQVRRLAIEIGGALAAGHAAGIVHRDVKPSNVLFDGDGAAKLADFGIARRFVEIEQALTSTGTVVGTRNYVSPEQASGQDVTYASDVFSLGVTLFEAVTGDRPPPATERPTGDVIDPRRLVPAMDPVLAATISTATSIEIDRRFSSMAAMVRSLDDVADPVGSTGDGGTITMPAHLLPRPEPIVAPTPDLADQPVTHMGETLANDRHRHRRIVAVFAVVAVLLIGLVVVAVVTSDDGVSTGQPATSSTSLQTAGASTTSAPTATIASATSSVPSTTVDTPTTVAVAELIPGFPTPSTLEEFLATLTADPALAGRRGADLAKELDKLLDGDGDLDKEAKRLQDKIEGWLKRDEIDPVIAEAAGDFITEFVSGDNDT